jgi:imidazolonepropionase-like amidohydrolase
MKETKKYAFINGIMLDGTENMSPEKDRVILTDGERIEAVKAAGTDISGYEPIDLKGQYIMPGLINMHVHLAGNGKPQKKQRDNTALVNRMFSNPVTPKIFHMLVRQYARIELMSGVTTIRTVGGLRDLDSRVRDEIYSGKQIGPRILTSNEGISVPGGHMAGSVAAIAKNTDEAVQLVQKGKRQGVDFIKLMITGGVMDAKKKGVPGELKMPPEMIRAACDEAHRNGYIVAAHVESTEGLLAALENGVDSIEHGARPTEEIIELFKKKHAFVTTTISPALPYALFDRSVSNASEAEQYNGRIVFDGIVECSKAALANGIPVALGNDVGCPWISQYDFWREIVNFRKYVGVSQKFALYTATLRNAQLAGLGDVTGSIEPGKSADMIVCRENPLEDLQALRNVNLVMARGRLISNPKVRRKQILDRELDKFLDTES